MCQRLWQNIGANKRRIRGKIVNDKLKIVEDYLEFNNSFIDNLMVQIYTTQDDIILKEMGKACIKTGVHIDEARLKNWIKMCEALENIPNEISNDIALRNRLRRLQNKIKVLEHENLVLKSRLDMEIEE